jgi:two-component sensor histidine kinase/DNA-binding response OmpR family regulator
MTDTVNVLLVDDQPDKLLAYEVILHELHENLVKTSSAREALQFLLKNDVAVILIDVCMPELDGFQLAAMLREHPRFRRTAIIFISAVHLTDVDRLRGYAMGAVDYVPVPVIPDVLRAKVKIFIELYRKTRELEQLNLTLEGHVAERTAELEAANMRLVQSEQGRSLALAAGQMGSWEWDIATGQGSWDEGQYRICGVEPGSFTVSADNTRALLHPDDWEPLRLVVQRMAEGERTQQIEFRVRRPNGELRWCMGTTAASVDAAGNVVRISGVTIDITDRKEAEERQVLLAREVDHRARNALAIIQSIIRLTRAKTVDEYVETVEGRIKALALAHTLLSNSRWHGADLGSLVAEECAPYRSGNKIAVAGPNVSLSPSTAQGIALALHELATNAAKHGALSSINGKVSLTWQHEADVLSLRWMENGGPLTRAPSTRSFGLKVIRASIEQQLGGTAMFDWNPKGLRCELSIALCDATESAANDGAQRVDSGNGINGAALPLSAAIPLSKVDKPRVLLVEDEALVGIMIQDCLSEFGFQIVGPVCTASDALAAAKDGHFDAAILDINLGDGMVYQVAEILSSRHVPFVFVTGYDADSVDSRFREIPILQKPVERETLQKLFAHGSDHAVTALAGNGRRARA